MRLVTPDFPAADQRGARDVAIRMFRLENPDSSDGQGRPAGGRPASRRPGSALGAAMEGDTVGGAGARLPGATCWGRSGPLQSGRALSPSTSVAPVPTLCALCDSAPSAERCRSGNEAGLQPGCEMKSIASHTMVDHGRRDCSSKWNEAERNRLCEILDNRPDANLYLQRCGLTLCIYAFE